jgi:hypothetical protein
MFVERGLSSAIFDTASPWAKLARHGANLDVAVTLSARMHASTQRRRHEHLKV